MQIAVFSARRFWRALVEAMQEIPATTLENLHHFVEGTPCPNRVVAP